MSLKRYGWRLAIVVAAASIATSTASAQPLAKAQVANLIVKVENGVDDFQDYLERRGDNAKARGSTAQAESRRAKRGAATESQKEAAKERKDELEDALDDLDGSTDRLRRRFDATDKWMETRVQVERVLDDGRKINQAVVRGNYGTEAAKLWGVLRTAINDLARAYGLQPLAL
jgi:hypothetical protein